MEFWIGMENWGFGDSCIVLIGVAFSFLGASDSTLLSDCFVVV
jgi:hypothetical protein